jgi:hypothetical protein
VEQIKLEQAGMFFGGYRVPETSSCKRLAWTTSNVKTHHKTWVFLISQFVDMAIACFGCLFDLWIEALGTLCKADEAHILSMPSQQATLVPIFFLVA